MLNYRLQLGVYDTFGGELIADWTYRARNVKAKFNEHGPSELTGFVPMRRWRSLRWYARTGTPHVQLADAAGRYWSGRLEDVRMVDGGIEFTALGYWSMLSDNLYTTVWINTSYDGFMPATTEFHTAYAAVDNFEMDTNNRVFIGLKKDAVYTAGQVGELIWRAPNTTQDTIEVVTFTYDVFLPTGYTARLAVWAEDYTSGAQVWTLGGNGASQTGTATVTALNATWIGFGVSAPAATNAAENSAFYFKATNVVFKSVASGTAVTPTEIIKGITALFSGLQPTQLRSYVGRIQSNTLPLTQEIYEDQRPAEVINYLVGLGDSSSRRWVAGVDAEQLLFYQVRGNHGRTFYIDAADDMELERTLESLANRVYAIYDDPRGDRKRRTAIASDALSIARAGNLWRTDAIDSGSTSSITAGYVRDAALADRKDAAPRTSVELIALYGEGNVRVPPHKAQPGDTIIVRNFPAGAMGSAITRVRSFIISEIEVDMSTGKVMATPELPMATTDVMLAQADAGIKPLIREPIHVYIPGKSRGGFIP